MSNDEIKKGQKVCWRPADGGTVHGEVLDEPKEGHVSVALEVARPVVVVPCKILSEYKAPAPAPANPA